MQPDDSVYLGHMLDMATKGTQKVAGLSKRDYEEDENLRLALAHLVQMIGEAGRGVIVVIRDTSPTDPSDRVKQILSAPSRPVNELRDYGVGAQILVDLGVRDIILLSNSHRSIVGLEGFGLRVVEQRPVVPDMPPRKDR